MDTTDFIPVKDYAEKMNVSVQYIYSLIKNETLNSYKKNNLTYVQVKDDLSVHNYKQPVKQPVKENNTTLIENFKEQIEYFKAQNIQKDLQMLTI